MNNNEKIAYLLEAIMSMTSEYNMFYGLTFDEMLMSMDKKIMNITLGIALEIRELLEEGYSESQILELIQNIKFESEDNISEEEANYIKKDAKKTLKLIINNKEKEND